MCISVVNRYKLIGRQGSPAPPARLSVDGIKHFGSGIDLPSIDQDLSFTSLVTFDLKPSRRSLV